MRTPYSGQASSWRRQVGYSDAGELSLGLSAWSRFNEASFLQFVVSVHFYSPIVVCVLQPRISTALTMYFLVNVYTEGELSTATLSCSRLFRCDARGAHVSFNLFGCMYVRLYVTSRICIGLSSVFVRMQART